MTKWRDTEGIVGAVKDLISGSDLKHICRILTSGCLAEFNWEESAEDKDAFIWRDNNPSVDRNIDTVTKTLNKKEKQSCGSFFKMGCSCFISSKMCTPDDHSRQGKQRGNRKEQERSFML